MISTVRQVLLFLAILTSPLINACDLSDEIERSRQPEKTLEPAKPPQEGENREDELPQPVIDKRDEILGILETGSLRQLTRLAQQYPDFRSNYGELDHYRHWYIMKRAGLDPIIKTQQILQQPYGIKDFGAEKYFIWPALAVRAPEDLEFSKLSFADRVTLQELVGEAGIERMKAGEAYPGFRLAIRQDGTWVYLLQDN